MEHSTLGTLGAKAPSAQLHIPWPCLHPVRGKVNGQLTTTYMRDINGTLWMYGGWYNYSFISDNLWRYDGTFWVWVSGNYRDIMT